MPPPAQKYDDEVDFAALATHDPDFAKYLGRNGYLDFRNPQAVKQLTTSLLRRDFGIEIDLPDDRLCPPVPVRYNYVRWIQSLIDTTSSTYSSDYDTDRPVFGLDIGTGASAIYPLIACSLRRNWRMLATDIDKASLDHASNNVELNDIEDRVRLIPTKPSDTFFGPVVDLIGDRKIDFTMCNPPFYSSNEEMKAALTGEGKALPPSAVCTGTLTEMVTDGGDAGFVLRMVQESAAYKNQVQWFSSMFGKLDSASKVVAVLKQQLGVDGNWAVTCLRAGKKTRRWAVAWSFWDYRPLDSVARGESIPKELHPRHTGYESSIHPEDEEAALQVLERIMMSLEAPRGKFFWRLRPEQRAVLVLAKENVWSRFARRKQRREQRDGEQENGGEGEMDIDFADEVQQFIEVGLAVIVSVEQGLIRLRWLRGREWALVESFWVMLVKKIKAELGSLTKEKS